VIVLVNRQHGNCTLFVSFSCIGIETIEIFLLEHMGQVLIELFWLVLSYLFRFLTELKIVAVQKHVSQIAK
jgi:hypothetical protein